MALQYSAQEQAHHEHTLLVSSQWCHGRISTLPASSSLVFLLSLNFSKEVLSNKYLNPGGHLDAIAVRVTMLFLANAHSHKTGDMQTRTAHSRVFYGLELVSEKNWHHCKKNTFYKNNGSWDENTPDFRAEARLTLLPLLPPSLFYLRVYSQKMAAQHGGAGAAGRTATKHSAGSTAGSAAAVEHATTWHVQTSVLDGLAAD